MEREHSLILDELARSVVEMDKDRAREAATAALRMKVDPYLAIMQGLAKGMDKVNELYEAEEYFVPEILVCADAMYAGIEVLRPYLPKEEAGSRKKVVIGVMKGDTHDIGKNLVKILLDNAGFEMHDLGRDVAYAKFVDTAGAISADIVCLSTLMTTTMDGMEVVIHDLKKAGSKAKVLVGGGPISPGFAKNIGADGYAKNAAEAVKVARSVLANVPLPSFITEDKREPILVLRSTGGLR